MAKPRKIQLQSAYLKVGNFKGMFSDLAAFSQPDALSNDMWLYTGVTVTLSDVMLRNNDLVIKTVDDPATDLTSANLANGKWKIVRHLTDAEINWLAAQLYNPPSASLSGGISLEKNYSVSPYSTSLSWSVTAGTNPITTCEFQKKEGAGVWTKVKDLTGTSGTETVSVTINTDTQFRILVSSKAGEAVYSSIRSVTFQYKTGYRVGAADAVADDTWMKAGAMALDSSVYGSFTLSPGSGEHMYYYVPASMVSSPYLSPPYFYVGGFEGGFEVYSTSAVYTLGDGTTINYVVYRSSQPNLGNTTVTISAS